MTAYIKAISYYLPQEELSNDQLAAMFPEWDAKKIAAKIGVEKRHIAAADEFASDMAIQAANKLFSEHQIFPRDIDFLLYCTQSPDYFLPTTACIIQTKLGLPVSAGALDFNLGCSGYVYGLALAKGLIFSGVAKNILLITSETYSKFIHPDDKGNRTIFGDGASATLISGSGFAEIGQFALGTDGSGAQNLIVKEGGLKYPRGSTSAEPFKAPPDFLHMDGPQIFSFTSEVIPELVKATLANNKLVHDEIEQYIFHQANQFLLNFLRKKIGIPAQKFYINMTDVGNTVSSSIPIALYEAVKALSPKAGDKWILTGFGVGYSWAGTVLYFN